jgi:hypothetical protein
MGLFSIKVFSSNVYQLSFRTRSITGLKPTNHVKLRDHLTGVFLVCYFLCCCFFFTDLTTSLNNFIPVHLTVISPHHRRLCFYFWTFVCSNCDIFHLLGTDKCWCLSFPLETECFVHCLFST